MKAMRKPVCVLLALVCAFAFTACGETNVDGNGGDNGDNDNNQTHIHEFTAEVVSDKYLASPATCTAKAKYYYSCACGEKGSTTFESGETLPHTYDKRIATDEYFASPATTTSAAKYYYSCVCGAKGTTTFEHGEPEKPSTEELRFRLLSDDTYEVLSYTGTATEVVIPSNYNGKRVTSVGEQAFVNCRSLTSITIPSDVTSIGTRAFNGCYRLVEVYNLSSLNITKSTDDNGYVGYYALDVYTDKDAPSKLTKENDFVVHADGNVKTVVGYFGDKTEITIPYGVTNIGSFAFCDSGRLTSVTIPNSVTIIGRDAFDKCSKLTSITIPNSVTSIGFWAFYGCYRLVEVYNFSSLSIRKGVEDIDRIGGYYALDIYTDKDVPSKLTRKNDFVVHSDGNAKTLIDYFGDKTELTIPNDVTSIGDYAFSGCSSLTSIEIPNSVTSIGDDAINSERDFRKTQQKISNNIENSLQMIA